jgi:Na+/phosphate symporter
MIIALSLLIAVVGLLMYVLASNPKVQEIGRIMLFCGLLAFLMGGVGDLIKAIPGR